VIVADSSALIALGQIDQLRLLSDLCLYVVIPQAVDEEVRDSPSLPRRLPEWIEIQSVVERALLTTLPPRLHPGEREAIVLAQTRHLPLLIDEQRGRKVATQMDIPVIGVLGVLLAARRRGLLALIRPEIDALQRHGFWLDAGLVRRVLAQSGE
jgi:uncharacterized protein